MAEIVFHMGKYKVISHRAYQTRDTPRAQIHFELPGRGSHQTIIDLRSEEVRKLLSCIGHQGHLLLCCILDTLLWPMAI